MGRAGRSHRCRNRGEISNRSSGSFRMGQLGMALSGSELAGGTGFREQFEREWLYGAFLAACLRTTGSFSATSSFSRFSVSWPAC